MLFRGIVKKYTAYLILLTKFKKIIGMKSEKVVKNMKVPVSIMEFLLQSQGTLGDFLFEILHFMVFRGIGFLKPFCLIFSQQN